jgi:predicted transcriptional regulator
MYETNRRPPTAAQVASALDALASAKLEEGGEVYWRIDNRYLFTWCEKTGFSSREAVEKGLEKIAPLLDKRN